MKGSDQFKEIIKDYLEQRAASDSLFADLFKKENKSIDGCVNYILSEVKKSGINGFADDEIFGMAVHYYDEDEIKECKPTASVQIVTNRQSTDAPKDEVKKKPAVKKPQPKDPDNYPYEQLAMF
jgi:hypothetical protein